MKELISLRISTATRARLRELAESDGTTQTEIVSILVDREYERRMKLDTNKIAWQIYVAHYGKLDDKRFRAEKVQEIMDWLDSGEPSDDLDALVAEWAEYDAEDIARV